MPDYFNWRNNSLDAETLYFYCTLLRLGYQPGTAHWDRLIDEMDLIDGVHIHYPLNADDPGWTLVYGPTGGAFVLPGSLTFYQFREQALYSFQVPNGAFEGSVVSFYRRVYLTIIDGIIEAAQAIMPRPLTVCGHSLGGAVSQLIGQALRVRFGDLFQGVITAGSPMVGNPNFATHYAPRLVRLENTGDPAPLFPGPVTFTLGPVETPFGRGLRPIPTGAYWHAGERWLVGFDSAIVITRGWAWSGEYPPPPSRLNRYPSFDLFRHHIPGEYARRIRSRMLRFPPSNPDSVQRIRLLDEFNVAINTELGEDWKLDPIRGVPRSWVIDPLAASPSPGINVNAPDP